MHVVAEGRKAWVVFSLTLRYLLGTRRGIVIAFLAFLPALVAGSIAAAGVRPFNIDIFQLVMVPLFLQVVLVFVTLVPATALIREEIDDNTLPFLLIRPISKPAIAVWKYVGYLVAVLVVLLPPLVLAYGITQAYAGDPFSADLDVLGAFLATATLGAAAYGAFFELLSVLVRRPLAVGLLFGFVWESIIGSIPGDVPRLSIVHYLRSVFKGLVTGGPLQIYRTDMTTPIAAAVLIGFAIAVVIFAAYVFQQEEFHQKA